ncbi:hypothetical protein R9C00_27095 [Flammeovirgaceae bacterium SG7u.111]|nr:hypothetical protein [Flammeovirgaceae bacterium SG7u.132]WPO35368.1 hypothetical protein R9C00_27095 [Flammeovirgaceae bacterium SG7u.111]
MTKYIESIQRFAKLEKDYHSKFPNAQPVGNFFAYFELDDLLDIIQGANGKEIKFTLEKQTNSCSYSYL